MLATIKNILAPATTVVKGERMPEDWLLDVGVRTQYTPDIWKLQMYEAQLLFVCDEMQTGLVKHDLITDLAASRLWVAFTHHPYAMFKKKLGLESFPIVLDEQSSRAPYTKIKGELYLVPPHEFVKLDNYKLNGVVFQRRQVPIDIPYRHLTRQSGVRRFEYAAVSGQEVNPKGKYHTSEKIHTVKKVWMYFGVPEHWNKEIDAGYQYKTVRTFTPRKAKSLTDEYYCFTREELKPE